MKELIALAERVEGLAGPDFGVAAEVLHAFGYRPDGSILRDPAGKVIVGAIPNPTASLDAAMSLVPEGARVQLADWDHEDLRNAGPWQAIIIPPGGRSAGLPKELGRCEHGRTPALALTAAALRARMGQVR